MTDHEDGMGLTDVFTRGWNAAIDAVVRELSRETGDRRYEVDARVKKIAALKKDLVR